MQGIDHYKSSKEVLELLTKAKDMRLNVAIFLVSTTILYTSSQKFLEIEGISKTILQGLFFITSIRLVYGVIGLGYDFISEKLESKKEKLKRQEEKDKSEKEYQKKIATMRRCFPALYNSRA